MPHTCLVTGAGRGIGRAVATRLAASGHRVALTARSAGELDVTAAACAGETLVIPADLTADGAVGQVFDTVEKAWGGVDVLVANAGVAQSAPLTGTTDELWNAALALNLTVPFQCLRRATPGMVERGYGRVVVVASVAAKHGEPYLAAYTASKHGVLGLVRSAAAELSQTGVTVNAVCPAYVDTSMTERSVARLVSLTGRDPAELLRLLERKQPIGRLINVEEVADAVEFCVKGTDAFTGLGLDVAGGAIQS
ncbi:MAG: SDR family NAD(P)-dependent oxidoreductase [Mycobacteriales bacterium]